MARKPTPKRPLGQALLAYIVTLSLPATAWACTTCNRELQAALFDASFVPRLLAVTLPLLGGGIAIGAAAKWIASRIEDRASAARRQAPVVCAGTFLGLGLGGFLDGIVLHQVLQLHQMMSSRVSMLTLDGKNYNMFWDGVFHLGAWTLTVVGVVVLFRHSGRRDVLFRGGVARAAALFGWGAFNVADSVFNHYLFRFHDVVQLSPRPGTWNLAFLLFGLAQAVVGGAIVRARLRRPKISDADHETITPVRRP